VNVAFFCALPRAAICLRQRPGDRVVVARTVVPLDPFWQPQPMAGAAPPVPVADLFESDEPGGAESRDGPGSGLPCCSDTGRDIAHTDRCCPPSIISVGAERQFF
jgi:hypothetical protein